MMRTFLFPACLTALLLAGCGGGVYLGYTWGDDDPPRVALVVSATEASAGQTLRLAVSAADDGGPVDHVDFFRYDGDRLVALGSDTAAPFELGVVVPSDGRPVLNLLAQAVDRDGQVGTSDVVSVTLR